jgi:hypothetical protein
MSRPVIREFLAHFAVKGYLSMRLLSVLLLCVASATALAVSPEKYFYLGEVKLSAPTGQPIGSQVILLEKTHNSDAAEIVESAIVVEAQGKTEQRTMRMVVKDDNTFSLTDEAQTIEGTGTLFGPRWKWTYFKGQWKAQGGITIEDENFMTDDAVITARKKVSDPTGRVLAYMDMSLSRITPKTFEILKAALLK